MVVELTVVVVVVIVVVVVGVGASAPDAPLIQLTKKQSLERPFQAARFVLSDLACNSVSLGAATLVLEEFLAQAGSKTKRKPTLRGGNR